MAHPMAERDSHGRKGEFFPVYIISVAASCRFSKRIQENIQALIEKKTPLFYSVKAFEEKKAPLSPIVLDALDQLANQYRLLTLKLFANEFNLYISKDGTLHIKMPLTLVTCQERDNYDPIAETQHQVQRLQTCLSMENPSDAPKIELHCDEYMYTKEYFNIISKLIEKVQCVKLDFTSYGSNSDSLIEILPLDLKHLKIVISGNQPKKINPIMKMIRENKTLESLSLIVTAGKLLKQELEPQEETWSAEKILKTIQKALITNTHFQEISLIFCRPGMEITYKITSKEFKMLITSAQTMT